MASPCVFPSGGFVMLIPEAPRRGQGDIGKANCAGQGCPERSYCRRFQVRIWPGALNDGTGRWGSFDLERAAVGGECPNFVRWIGERRAV